MPPLSAVTVRVATAGVNKDSRFRSGSSSRRASTRAPENARGLDRLVRILVHEREHRLDAGTRMRARADRVTVSVTDRLDHARELV
jgi:hypothetical protein